ncbi:response regulator [Pseudochryseolinea flava]|uniref:Response regulator n=1 Tax=Pseudochryseolinea flava TaxID=2059302 RepID=A0A364XYK4_9BACT|nr:response regulator [Pseudochryseolinea flava]RAV99541.1 response regulator [Pseudochryseolinea flava]
MQRSILIIDDDEDDCMLIKDSLVQIGIRHPIKIVLGGQQALDLLQTLTLELPLLIILDLNMPLMDGFQVLDRINSDYKIPVVMYTTSCDDETVAKAKSAGAIDCIKKGTSYADNLKFAKYIFDLTKEFKS